MLIGLLAQTSKSILIIWGNFCNFVRKNMIKLNNVHKSYISKSKQRVDALRGVDFELPNLGMVFILGKSGSGKSTLLNILGGLDAPTEGEILVDGVSMKDFKPTDYDSYRNGYVGFIFQEYNLLDDFNVRENIALALQLSKETDIDEKVKDALTQVELNDSYLLRRVGEMAGGEKQRVAIARSIVKDSSMILADEPTGNLDSATGESIWNILKKLSQSKLVVAVSHDRESAEKYGDRIIEIADGRIVSDSVTTVAKNSENPTPSEEKCDMGCEKHEFCNIKKRLSLRACLKMGLNNLGQRKVKTVSVILLSILTILTLLITEMFIAYAPARTVAKFIKQYDVPYFAINQYKRNEKGELFYNHILRDDTVDYLDKKCEYIIDGIVENKQQILDFGFSFIGDALELTNESFYATSSAIKSSVKDYWSINYFIDDEGDRVYVDALTPYEWLIGKRVYLSYYSFHIEEDNLPILAGVIDSDAIDEKTQDYIPPKFVRADYEYKSLPTFTVNNYTNNAVLQLGDGSYDESLTLSTYMPYTGLTRCLLTADGVISEQEFSEITVADDEIVLTFELYAKFFETDYKWTYVDPSTLERLDAADTLFGLGEELDFKIYNEVTGKLIVDLGKLNLVGIVFQTFYSTYEADVNFQMILSEQNCEKLNDLLSIGKTILVKTDSVANLSGFMSRLSNKYDTRAVRAGKIIRSDGKAYSDIANYAYGVIDTVNSLMFIMTAICAIMVVVLVLLVINLISFNISNRKREIGILSALGTSNKDITKIFIFETLVIAAISFVVTLISSFILAFVFNTIANRDYVEFISLFRVDILTVAVLAASSFGLLLLATLIPTRKIAKLKPIDAIRNV